MSQFYAKRREATSHLNGVAGNQVHEVDKILNAANLKFIFGPAKSQVNFYSI